ncbi:hypothetical protein [Cystobacter fuscus]|uniref:hypothetical protein n=1 Tax=Cystobacter fuscus TaxID=43 RepID=UPI0018DF2228
MGRGVTAVRFAEGRVHYLRTRSEGGAVFDAPGSLPCEVLRSTLKLPACPRSAAFEDARVTFQGHGEGLDVEAAKASGAPQEQLLEAAYGAR